MRLFSLRFFARRYRALLWGGNALAIGNILFLLAFSEGVTDVTDVTGTCGDPCERRCINPLRIRRANPIANALTARFTSE